MWIIFVCSGSHFNFWDIEKHGDTHFACILRKRAGNPCNILHLPPKIKFHPSFTWNVCFKSDWKKNKWTAWKLSSYIYWRISPWTIVVEAAGHLSLMAYDGVSTGCGVHRWEVCGVWSWAWRQKDSRTSCCCAAQNWTCWWKSPHRSGTKTAALINMSVTVMVMYLPIVSQERPISESQKKKFALVRDV